MDYIDNGNSVYIIMNKEYGNRVIIQEMGESCLYPDSGGISYCSLVHRRG